ncbi:MAG: hypothetical protein V1926_00140 [Candidatus Peregrinibacteria bacterium]
MGIVALPAFAVTSLLPQHYPVLAECSRYVYNLETDTYETPLFEDVDFASLPTAQQKTAKALENWPIKYHANVSAIIAEALGSRASSESPLRRVDPPPHCSAVTSAAFLAPRAKLFEIARGLPSWKDPAMLSRLGQEDMGTVLLEYLRMYECALVERFFLYPIYTADQEAYRQKTLFGLPVPSAVMEAVELWGLANEEKRIISEELSRSRLALTRALSLLEGLDHLLTFDAEITCVQQASLDLRNSFALAADASSCLLRAWNNRDPLRDSAP